MTTIKRGGKRKHAGRNAAADPKVPVAFYIEESKVEALGGIIQVRNMLIDFMNEKVITAKNGR